MSNYSACGASSAYNLSCLSSVGGLRKVYIMGGGSITGSTEASGEISTLVGNGSLYEFELEKNGGSSLTETLNNSLEAGTLFYQQDLVMVFHKLDTEIRNQVKLLSQSRGLQIVVEDNNGYLWALGLDFEGGFLSAGSGTTGVNFGDANQYSITASFYSRTPMMKLDDTLPNVVSGISVVNA